METKFDIGIHCKFCCHEFQIAGCYGRHLGSKHAECAVASVVGHDELLQHSEDTGRVPQNSPAQSRQNSGHRQKRAHSMCDICNNLLARVAKRDRGTGSELVAIAATTETVLVPYVLEIGQHGAEAEDYQDALENDSRQIPASIRL